MSTAILERFRSRLGLAQLPAAVDEQALRMLAGAWAATVPFENLRLHPIGTVDLDEERILGHLLQDREGGICYEQNVAFARLLTELGARVQLLAGTVESWEAGTPRRGIEFGHLALSVEAAGELWHIDVGFGGSALVLPPKADGDRVEVAPGRSYLVDATPRRLSEFAGGARWHSDDPRSRFQQSIVCSLLTPDPLTLSGVGNREGGLDWRLRDGGERRELSAQQAATALRERFGISRPLPVALRRH